ncbi:hypothetical protein NGM44_00415 [Moraxella sp. FZFQ2102]|uniref:hypothetical protein n=1 Tax=Moraxella sp. FZFQ2102 TaxID=2953752 RepID=UPI00209BDBAD|nr:hypothetical protein [Moraxella sp. FZFQ2102]USZ14900.1 hypothetical protein NGM44_00415 [Moraxella sp. FZFQ2102]
MTISTRNAATIVRTGTAVMASEAKQQFIRDNPDLVTDIRIIATLDLHISPICRHLDHEIMPIDKAQYPPYHYNCRSNFQLVFKGEKQSNKRASMNGETDNVSYYDWLKSQSKDVQVLALGKERAKLFDKMSAERFKSYLLSKIQ